MFYMMFLFKLFGLKGRRKLLFDCDKMLKQRFCDYIPAYYDIHIKF